MPCFADTIVRIKFSKRNVKEETGLISVWAVRTYPVGNEDCLIELVLFVPIDGEERDLDTQTIFEKDEFYSVGGKIVPGKYNNDVRPKMTVSSSTQLRILDKVPLLNRCPLKVSLVGISQGTPNEINNDVNAIFEMVINDYAVLDYKFIVKIIYPYHKRRFDYIKNSIKPLESIIFVVGIMEIIEGNFYVYANEINNIDIARINVSDNKSQTASIKSARSKLLFTYQNIKNVESSSDIKASSDDIANKYQYEVFSDDSCSSRYKKGKDVDRDIENLEDIRSVAQKVDFTDEIEEKVKESSDDSESEKKSRTYRKNKRHMTRSSIYKNKKLRKDVDDNDDVE
ncbi:9655_t:CDS:2 [Cetraspora pellucida]|uniref:9655_t:CDS:1 n=1 Tax=Cetraspora pellucida TaxID=1433469 RepID=A0A9N9EJG9_9GLOM|nr:9655_t:CDS:2 [Cetraspora pellucida]